MNVLQIMRQAEFEIDSIRAGNTRSGMWTAEETLSACNLAMDRTARLLRLAGSEILTKTINSNAVSIDLISEVYNPVTSLAIQSGVHEYTLPPDFVRVANIRPLSTATGFTGVRFRPSSYSDPTWVDLRTIPEDQLDSADGDNVEYSYVIRGARTLHLAPIPQDNFNIQLVYHYRAPRLRYYSVGTVERTNGAVGVVGSGTSWLSEGLRDPAELLVGVTAVTGVVLDQYYPTIRSINTNTTLTLARPATTTDGSGQAYTIAMSPILPEEHHTWLSQLVAATMLRKVDADLSGKMQMDLGQQLLDQVVPEITLRQMQASLVGQAFSLWS